MQQRWGVLLAGGILVALLGGGMWFWQAQQAPATPATSDVATSASSRRVSSSRPSTKKVAAKTTNGKLTKAQAIKQIDNLMASHHIMGTLLLTNSGPSGVDIRTYGYADMANQVRNTKTEAYPLASLQKAVTGAVIQTLINEGKLTMTTRLSTYFPQVRFAQDITIRQLLDHTSGIRMAEPLPKTILPTESAQINFTLRHLVSTDNHAYSYSNANFTLLAGVIRKVTGKSYMTVLRNTIIKPLGLKHTYAYNDIPGNVVNPFSYSLTNGISEGAIISKPLQSSELGCGSLYMSVGDYYKFINSLVTGKLLGVAGRNELTANFQSMYSAGVYYQSGHHMRIGGNDNAFHTYYMGTTDGRIGVVLFENQGMFSIDNQVGYAIQSILMKTEPF